MPLGFEGVRGITSRGRKSAAAFLTYSAGLQALAKWTGYYDLYNYITSILVGVCFSGSL